jgi:hypothetical protein
MYNVGGFSVLVRQGERSWPISRVLSGKETLPGRSFLSECSHLYSLAAYPWRLGWEGLSLATYLALLQLGFTMPSVLPRTR